MFLSLSATGTAHLTVYVWEANLNQKKSYLVESNIIILTLTLTHIFLESSLIRKKFDQSFKVWFLFSLQLCTESSSVVFHLEILIMKYWCAKMKVLLIFKHTLHSQVHLFLVWSSLSCLFPSCVSVFGEPLELWMTFWKILAQKLA